MTYHDNSLEARLLVGDPEAVVLVSYWIATFLTMPRYWRLKQEWRDLHQETMTCLIESLRRDRFDTSRDLRAYVQGIARHIATQRLQKMYAEGRGRFEAPAPDKDANPEHQVMKRQLVRRVLDMASEECRELIAGYFLGQRSYEEIAQELEVPVGTVKSRLFRCLESAYRAVAGIRSSRSLLVKKE
ncbi:MAG TPA: sigma-70 family RNA polymerase sigma factor [Candidatus Polarisedimenticolia bacterium]|nr:sigma-70 family RNA polymerase sigma factor [Candidatus Polarisedimenticolia bacterium]